MSAVIIQIKDFLLRREASVASLKAEDSASSGNHSAASAIAPKDGAQQAPAPKTWKPVLVATLNTPTTDAVADTSWRREREHEHETATWNCDLGDFVVVTGPQS